MISHTSYDPLSTTNMKREAKAKRQRRSRVLWTLSNLLMLAGVYLLVYVGGLYVQIEYQREAARGDSDIAAPQAVLRQSAERVALKSPLELVAPQEAPFRAPVLASSEARTSQEIAAASVVEAPSVERVTIPSIAVDSKVIGVGWHVEEQDGGQVAVWEVAEYAVGQHEGSANPGEGSNVVLAGHVGGYGLVFRDLFYVKPGDQITLYSHGQQYLYVVTDRLVLDEENVPPEQRLANAQYIAPTDSEVVTLVTCWPDNGADRFTQRVVVRAVPFGGSIAAELPEGGSVWSIR